MNTHTLKKKKTVKKALDKELLYLSLLPLDTVHFFKARGTVLHDIMSNADSVRNFTERSRSKISFLGKKNNSCNYPITRCGASQDRDAKKVKSVS